MDGVWVILKVLYWHLFGEIQYEILGAEAWASRTAKECSANWPTSCCGAWPSRRSSTWWEC